MSFQLLETFRVFKLSHFIRKSLRPILKTTALIHFSPCYQKLFNCSKNVQEIVHNKTEEFLSKNKILYTFQSRFRKKNYPANTCLDSSLIKLLPDSKKAFHWNDFNWFKKSVWHHWPPSFTKENEIIRLFQKHGCMV